MEKQHKIIVGCPVGRKQTLEILVRYVLKQRPFIDEFRLWVNTTKESDREYIKSLADQYPDFITLDFSAENNPSQGRNAAVCLFYPNCIDENTVYFKIDDDIVWMEEGFFEKMYEFRIQNRDYFLVFANTINNACIDYLHQRRGLLPGIPSIYYFCGDPIAWSNPVYCVTKHEYFINAIKNKTTEKYKLGLWIDQHQEQISINCICWMGEDFAKFQGKVGSEDEKWLSSTFPREIGKLNCIAGDVTNCHNN